MTEVAHDLLVGQIPVRDVRLHNPGRCTCGLRGRQMSGHGSQPTGGVHLQQRAREFFRSAVRGRHRRVAMGVIDHG